TKRIPSRRPSSFGNCGGGNFEKKKRAKGGSAGGWCPPPRTNPPKPPHQRRPRSAPPQHLRVPARPPPLPNPPLPRCFTGFCFFPDPAPLHETLLPAGLIAPTRAGPHRDLSPPKTTSIVAILIFDGTAHGVAGLIQAVDEGQKSAAAPRFLKALEPEKYCAA